jgi:hypothetical protein
MERLQQHAWELAMGIAAISPAACEADKARRLRLMDTYEAVYWAVGKLRTYE